MIDPLRSREHRIMQQDYIPAEITSRLMKWFEANRRVMPWRGESDPYKIWVSEVMLQQTQVKTVVPYYRRWMEQLPAIDDLAAAQVGAVLKLWEGLGYYSRARNLCKGARYVQTHFKGRLPADYTELRRIPGIGPYIAAAVASIAFHLPVGVVDANTGRVMARLFAIRIPTHLAGFKNKVKTLIESGFHGFDPGWVNQAWMEFGAVHCLPKPVCSGCIFRQSCRAFRQHAVSEFPQKAPTARPPVRRGAMFYIPRKNEILLVRRKENGMLGGLWELPNILYDELSFEQFIQKHGIEIVGKFSRKVRGQYTHFKVEFELFSARDHAMRDDVFSTYAAWIDRRKISELPRSKVHIRAMKLIEAGCTLEKFQNTDSGVDKRLHAF